MSALGLEELLDFENTAAWRSMKAEQFPDDQRNVEAAELIGRFAEILQSLNRSSVHERINSAFDKIEAQGNLHSATEEVGQMMESVCFHWFPETAETALSEIADKLESLVK
ncbi:hypothetical protein V5F29_12100 [Xanthobacter aminoxidans]|uniref:hypothetical protein n=1 Tax=Xanthobacter aminoxidans TaxID=186280 RepID=UPI0037278D77